MNFYIIDDMKEMKEFRARPNWDPNAQYKGTWCDAWSVDRKNGTYEKCPLCGRPVSMLKWEEPRKMRLSNTRYPDRLSSWLTEPLVVSERFMNAYWQEKLSGVLSFSEIEVVKVSHRKASSSKPPRYFLADLCFSKSIRINLDQTMIHGQKHDWSCALCNPFGSTCDSLERLVLDTDQWDGVDIFQVYAVGVVCSQRFYDFIDKHGFTNFNLVQIEKYRRP